MSNKTLAILSSVTPQNLKWMDNNVHYLTMMGSQAYGTTQNSSDIDIYGWAIPPKEWVFPHLAGHIDGFGEQPNRFEQFVQHHVKQNGSDREYDFSVYNVVKYLHLVVENNPNMIDSLFVPVHCILHITAAAEMVRDARRQFLHKGAYHKFKGYAISQLHKMKNREGTDKMNTKRRELIKEQGFDTKYGMHLIRLLDECEQILLHGDIDLQRNNEQHKAIRRGDYTQEQVEQIANAKITDLESLYATSNAVPDRADWKFGQNLLHNVLEHHYGSLTEVKRVDNGDLILRDLRGIVERYG